MGSSSRGRGSTIQDDAMSTYSRKSSLKGSRANYRDAQSPARSRVRFSHIDSDEDGGEKTVGSIMDKYLSK